MAYLALDHDRGCDVIWNIIHVFALSDHRKELFLKELVKLKDLHHENVNTILDVWEQGNNNIIFISDHFVGGSIRQYNISYN